MRTLRPVFVFAGALIVIASASAARAGTPAPAATPLWSFQVTASPASQTTTCPATTKFTAIQHNGNAGLQYRYIRSDGATGPIYTSAVSAGDFPAQGTSWTLGKTYSGWAAIQWRPLPQANGGNVAPWQINSNKATFSLTCT